MSNERTGAVMDEAKFLNELADEMTTAGRPATAGKLRAAAALLAASRPAPGYLRASEGADMRVEGPMPITKDNAVVYDRAWWIDPANGDFVRLGRSFAKPEDGRVVRFGPDGWFASIPMTSPRRVVPLSECFSTPEAAEEYAKAARTAAESAKGGRHAE